MAKQLLDISPDDQNRLKRDETRHPVVRYLKNKENMAFNIGDILIKRIRRTTPHQGETWITEMMSSASKTPRKYVFLHENEWGVGYIKRLKADGSGTCGPMMCMADVEYTWVRYEVDPEYSDHILLGEQEKYHYNERFRKEKEERQEIHKYNRSILISTKSYDIVNERVRMLKPGTRFWYNRWGIGISDLQNLEYEVVSNGKQGPPGTYNAMVKWVGTGKDPNGYSQTPGQFTIAANDITNKAFTFTRPKSMKDIYG